MKREESIEHLNFMKNAYEHLIKEQCKEGIFTSDDGEIKGEWKSDTAPIEQYKTMIQSLDVAIETMKSYDIARQKEYNEGFNACFDSLIPNQEKMYERGKADVLKVVEDIRAEIDNYISDFIATDIALQIIDKHIKGVSNAQEL